MPKKSLVDKDKRDSMVVMLEGYPEEDIDATLPEDSEAETVDEAMSEAEPVGEDDLTGAVTELVQSWEPKSAEGKQYKTELAEVLGKYNGKYATEESLEGSSYGD